MKIFFCAYLMLGAACILANASEMPSAVTPAMNPALQWQAMARADLVATHDLILSTHPGSIDEFNPAFRDWTTTGYQQALALIPKVFSYDTAMAAVRYYVSGFLDGHFIYSDNARRRDYPITINGWTLREEKGRYIVAAVAEQWKTPLPQKGARLVECDGQSPDALIRERVAPYIDRRDFPAVRASLANGLMALHLAGEELQHCRFEDASGSITDIGVSYAPVNSRQYFRMIMERKEVPQRRNGYSVNDGILWIRAANFNLHADEARPFEAMLTQLSKTSGVRQIIFDSRGNGGGDSGVGDRLFEAATGGLAFDKDGLSGMPRTYAQWRVSDTAIATAEKTLAHQVKLYGDNTAQAQDTAQRLAQLQSARAAGRPWVKQEGSYRVRRADAERWHGHLRRFQGGIALITDANCASACLDFADLVLQVPGAMHLGQATSGDSVYIDVGRVELPSKNLLVLPLKVWRNRVRGNNETLVPDMTLQVDMDDDAAVQDAVRTALKL